MVCLVVRQKLAQRKMWTTLLPSVLLTSVLLNVGHCDDSFTGPGLWHVNNVMKCDEDARMPVKIDVTRRKINRTHDGFNAKIKLEEVVDETYALRCDICKVVDGGCKQYQVLAEDSLAKFVNKFAADNRKRFLEMAKIDPPDFPIPIGEHVVTGYVMNYEELPEDGPYGGYQVKAFVLKNAIEKACVEMHVEFQKKED